MAEAGVHNSEFGDEDRKAYYREYRRRRRAQGLDRSVRLGDRVTTENAAKERLRNGKR